MIDIIDVSKYQGVIDWARVTASTVIIRIGYRSGKTGRIVLDEMARRNLLHARRNGKKIGLYFWSQALTIDEAREEADFCCDHAGRLDLPIYLDSESASDHNGRADRLTKDARTVTVMAFCTRVMERGYKAGVYSGQSWWKTCLDYDKLKAYSIWVARYNTQKPTYPPRYDFWQYSSKEKMAGIQGYVDASVRYGEDVKPAPAPASKNIMIGQASKGETGIKGQIAGNQTGTELNVKPYYLHKQGWRVFRHPDPVAQNKIAFAMLNAVNNACIGYDQNLGKADGRNTLYIASQKYGFDPGKVKIDVECDCSSLVRVCCAYAGIMLPDFNTGTEPQVLLGAGFKEVQIDQTTGAGLMLGDILVTKGKGHTCVCVQV